MDRSRWLKDIVKKMTSQKGQNYTYLTLFFIVFSFFVFFAIRPSLKTAFSLKQKEVALRQLDAEYEEAISKILAIQEELEKMRDNLHLVSEAIPDRPNVNKLIEDVELLGAKHSVALTEISVGEVNLKEEGGSKVKNLTLLMKSSSTFPNLMEFLTDLSNQRRIKLSENIKISGGASESSQSANLEISMDVQGYHL